ncbi:MAG: HAD-IA family hydrolase, partial [Candidatus Omnitrophica bacterium]|nr:HAD-IA family hydrolase [Candidatus Omnitrophota bacterium]
RRDGGFSVFAAGVKVAESQDLDPSSSENQPADGEDISSPALPSLHDIYSGLREFVVLADAEVRSSRLFIAAKAFISSIGLSIKDWVIIGLVAALSILLYIYRSQWMHLAYKDGLTNVVYNRRYLDMQMSQMAQAASQTIHFRRDDQAAILMIDLDYLKVWNTDFGHDGADKVILAVAQVIANTIRSEDVAARYGGDEFTVILKRADKEIGRRVAQKILMNVRKISFVHPKTGERRHVSLSIGVAAYPADGGTVHDVLRAADEAVYASKNFGRNRVTVFGEHKSQQLEFPFMKKIDSGSEDTPQGPSSPALKAPDAERKADAKVAVSVQVPTKSLLSKVLVFALLAFHRIKQMRWADVSHLLREEIFLRLLLLPRPLKAILKQKEIIWVNANCLAGFYLIEPLVKTLAQEYPGHQILLSSTDRDGLEYARKKFKDTPVIYVPVDMPFFINRFFKDLRVRLFVMTERPGGIGPNFLAAVKKSGAKIVLYNARSQQSVNMASVIIDKVSSAEILENIDLLLAQDEEEALKLVEQGAGRDRVRVTGNVKFDTSLPSLDPAGIERLRFLLGLEPQRPVIVAGSIHPEEYSCILQAFALLRRNGSRPFLLLAPRELKDAQAALGAAARLVSDSRSVRRTAMNDNAPSCGPPDIVVLDTQGELKFFYSLATVAVVGGSFAASRGGHNILEPASFAKPVIVGPNMDNFSSIVDIFAAAKGILQVRRQSKDGQTKELAGMLQRLLKDAQERLLLGGNALRIVQENRGAFRRSMESIAELLPVPAPALVFDFSSSRRPPVAQPVQVRSLSSPAIPLAWKLAGSVSDIKENVHERSGTVMGLSQNVVIRLDDGRVIFVTDDHAHVYAFWWLMAQEGLLKGGRLLHIDGHADAQMFQGRRSSRIDPFDDLSATLADADGFAVNVAGLEGFIAPLARRGLITSWHWLYNLNDHRAARMALVDGQYKALQEEKAAAADISFDLLDIDIDVLAGLTPEEAAGHLDAFAAMAGRASLITIATSPEFIDQKAAVRYARLLVERILSLQGGVASVSSAAHDIDVTFRSMPGRRFTCVDGACCYFREDIVPGGIVEALMDHDGNEGPFLRDNFAVGILKPDHRRRPGSEDYLIAGYPCRALQIVLDYSVRSGLTLVSSCTMYGGDRAKICKTFPARKKCLGPCLFDLFVKGIWGLYYMVPQRLLAEGPASTFNEALSRGAGIFVTQRAHAFLSRKMQEGAARVISFDGTGREDCLFLQPSANPLVGIYRTERKRAAHEWADRSSLDPDISSPASRRSRRWMIFDVDDTLYPHDSPMAEAYAVERFACIASMSPMIERPLGAEAGIAAAVALFSATEKALSKKQDGKLVSKSRVLNELGVTLAAWEEWKDAHVNPEDYLEPDYELAAMLKDLSSAYRFALWTNNNRSQSEAILRALGVGGYFDPSHIFCTSEFKRRKPDPGLLKYVIERLLETTAGHCVVVGDSVKTDIEPAFALGAKAVYIDPSGLATGRRWGAKVQIIQNIYEVADAIKAMKNSLGISSPSLSL